MKILNFFIFALVPFFFISCNPNMENAATAQTANAPLKEPQTNIKVSQTDVKESASKTPGRIIFQNIYYERRLSK